MLFSRFLAGGRLSLKTSIAATGKQSEAYRYNTHNENSGF
jgi:hypothetical protein